MSLRIAVAVAAMSGAGLLTSGTAQARPDMVGFRGDYSPGTIVVKTNERRLYLVGAHGHPMRYPVGVGRAGQEGGRRPQSRRQVRTPGWCAPRPDKARQAVDRERDSGRLAAQSDGRRG